MTGLPDAPDPKAIEGAEARGYARGHAEGYADGRRGTLKSVRDILARADRTLAELEGDVPADVTEALADWRAIPREDIGASVMAAEMADVKDDAP